MTAPTGIEDAETAQPIPVGAAVTVTVHSLDQALAAAQHAVERGLALHLTSVPGAAASAGFGWFAALVELVAERYPTLDLSACLDCADQPATAIGAMRRGLRHIRFSGSEAAYQRLNAIAGQFNAVIDYEPRSTH
jgi:hypothetical protein